MPKELYYGSKTMNFLKLFTAVQFYVIHFYHFSTKRYFSYELLSSFHRINKTTSLFVTEFYKVHPH